MKTKRGLLLTAILGLAASTAMANVFVYDVKVDASGDNVQLKYRLLDAAGASVEIEVFGPLPATTVLGSVSGTAIEGQNTVNWTGIVDEINTEEGESYGFRIVASKDTGHAEWTLLNNLDNQRFHYEQPRGGVSVNTDMTSEYFGTLYIGNTRSDATASGRAMAAGIYAIFPDGSDPLGFADTPATGGVDWTLSGTASPWKTKFGPDGMLYIPDWSDSHAGLWRAAEDLSGSWPEVLSNAGRDTAGLVAGVHGSIGGIFVEADGDDVVVFWQDEDLPSGTTPADGLRNIWKQVITPATSLPIATAPTLVIDENDFTDHATFDNDLGIFVNDAGGGILRDAEGNFWISNYRATGDNFACLMKFSPDGQELLWDSRTGIAGDTIMGVDPFINNLGGLTYDADSNTLFVSSGGNFYVFPLDGDLPTTTQELEDAITAVPTGGTLRGISIDPAKNIYAISNINERLSIFSPPGENSFTFENAALELPGGDWSPTAAGSWNLYQ